MPAWSDENKAIVADLLKAGKSASEIGKAIGVTRNAIVGIVSRDAILAAIGFARSANRDKARKPRVRKMVEKPKKPAQRQRTKITDSAPKCGTISVPVIDLNEAIDTWIQINGVRRFEQGDSADFFRVQDFLKGHGYEVSGSIHRKDFKVEVDGRRKSLGWNGLLEFADSIRVQSGMEPILPTSRR